MPARERKLRQLGPRVAGDVQSVDPTCRLKGRHVEALVSLPLDRRLARTLHGDERHTDIGHLHGSMPEKHSRPCETDEHDEPASNPVDGSIQAAGGPAAQLEARRRQKENRNHGEMPGRLAAEERRVPGGGQRHHGQQRQEDRHRKSAIVDSEELPRRESEQSEGELAPGSHRCRIVEDVGQLAAEKGEEGDRDDRPRQPDSDLREPEPVLRQALISQEPLGTGLLERKDAPSQDAAEREQNRRRHRDRLKPAIRRKRDPADERDEDRSDR